MINLLEAFKNEDGFTKKKFGQHFLTNKSMLDKIIEAADICENDNVIEIGPGCGVLTQLIAEKKANVTALEIDETLMEFLNRYLFFYNNLKIINQDAANVDYDTLYNGEKVIIIGNLPYNVSVKIFEKAAMRKNIKNMVFMFQKEVADRIIAKPNSKTYTSLSVFASYIFDIVKVKDISGANFWPNANVFSTVLKFIPKENRSYENNKHKEDKFFKFLRMAFRQKRKTLKNNLQEIDDISHLLSLAGLTNTSRAEELSLDKFKELFNIIYEKFTF